MLYLEDYLEMIEQLPMDLRDRFTEMREMDLQVQNAMDQLEQRVNEFFMNAKKNKPEWREEQMTSIKKDYYKALEDADEKVQLANQIYDLVDRHLRKLDQELAKFKMELEADNAGITEILERRSLELDTPSQPVNNHHAHSHTPVEKRKHNPSSHHSTTDHVPEKKFKSEALLSTLTSDASKENTPGSGAGAITMAAAQAVQATAQMKEGRRTSSLKASYEAFKNNDFQLGREFSLSRDSTGYSSSALASTLTQTLSSSTTDSRSGRKSKNNNKSSSQQSSSSSSSSSLSSCSSSSALAQELSQQTAVIPESDSNSQVDWTYDPNEPRYCICNQVSYGEMVGCDNQDCPIEWFHYGCVGLTEAPKGKWEDFPLQAGFSWQVFSSPTSSCWNVWTVHFLVQYK
ncbi:inhibitor of growth protein 3 isoform X3 [Aquila chrysaetos chrysaetos]|uniref:inhibitor of growth protein 3 isoform X3 n=1 Tax=Aquila chrysaetos chrysaetos TaxID=223781 RepID=UPI0005D07B4D|nr:inhibitor of growth protein 3 isoform X3 [Aquila chrysaetos chrysaetos]